MTSVTSNPSLKPHTKTVHSIQIRLNLVLLSSVNMVSDSDHLLGVEINGVCPQGAGNRCNTQATSQCRLCQHYQPQGRRGGTCQLLAVPVESNWKACAFGLPLFCHA